MVNRVYNFFRTVAMLPEEVLKEAASEMMDYRGCGCPHGNESPSQVFDDIIHEAEQDLQDLLQIPDNHEGIISFQGGACTAVCHDPHEPDEAWSGRLYRDRPVGKEGISGSTEIRANKSLFRG